MLPVTTTPVATSWLSHSSVSSRKILIVGLIMCFIAPPFAGLVYALAFIFNKETWREGLIILAWAIAWAIASFFLFQYLLVHGIIHSTLPVTTVQVIQ